MAKKIEKAKLKKVSNEQVEKSNTEPEQGKSRHNEMRDTIESIIIALVFAFVFRAYSAEAFVIPTGSMAPTLYGRHKELHCAECGVKYAVGASDELVEKSEYYLPDNKVTGAFCPNCRYYTNLQDAMPFTGDRIIVNKFPFDYGDPGRWDVIVFKYPEASQTNYIKRLVGLPGEELQISRGDVYARKNEKEPFQILRKDNLNKQLTVQQLVYDDDYPPREILEYGWPERWSPMQQVKPVETRFEDLKQSTWELDRETRAYQFKGIAGKAEKLEWLRYRHIVPRQSEWALLQENPELFTQTMLSSPPQSRLISDYTAYNNYSGGSSSGAFTYDAAFWVGDLTLSFDVEIQSEAGELLVELMRGDRHFRVRFDVKTGQAKLYFVEDFPNPEPVETELTTVETELKGKGGYSVMLANVDQRLCLWVNGSEVDLGTATQYQPPVSPAPREGDLAPAGITGVGIEFTVSHLMLQRDIYYRADEYYQNQEYSGDRRHLWELLWDPAAWSRQYEDHRQQVRFDKMSDEEFFVLGDNSARSADSRLWGNSRQAEHRHAVPRSALVGKAFMIYWPHGIPFMNDGRGYSPTAGPLKRFFYHQTRPGVYPDDPYAKLSIPFYPNFSRMKRIR
ncbi:signal peptidase I [Gimesia algae]|uniref:Signal peptidase I n=1 Tax=Gimesia algae TaxID=2527971 RepID=A0A517VMD2_9PLAN|nr:signal peptidase I [Gimesia algae]QDT94060.1 signal peptidase I [Gimesia algae]